MNASVDRQIGTGNRAAIGAECRQDGRERRRPQRHGQSAELYAVNHDGRFFRQAFGIGSGEIDHEADDGARLIVQPHDAGAAQLDQPGQ